MSVACAGEGTSSNYDQLQLLGKGAFGDVFLAAHKTTKIRYVLKKIKMAKQTEWQRAATQQELRLVSSLKHPFIVAYKEHWVHHNHTMCVVYNYAEKGDLASAVTRQRGRHFPEEILKGWLAQLLLACEFMHTRGILHRDLKGPNIFLSGSGDVLVGDFGLATLREPGDEAKHDQSVVGTPHYLSPELVSGKHYSFETDIWGLGCVMYELSSLKPPFNAFNLPGLVAKIKRSSTPPLPSLYSPGWAGLVNSLLHKTPSQRPSVLSLMANPLMAQAMANARQRAVELMPDIVLPPLMDVIVSKPASDLAMLDLSSPHSRQHSPSTLIVQQAAPSPLVFLPGGVNPATVQTAASHSDGSLQENSRRAQAPALTALTIVSPSSSKTQDRGVFPSHSKEDALDGTANRRAEMGSASHVCPPSFAPLLFFTPCEASISSAETTPEVQLLPRRLADHPDLQDSVLRRRGIGGDSDGDSNNSSMAPTPTLFLNHSSVAGWGRTRAVPPPQDVIEDIYLRRDEAVPSTRAAVLAWECEPPTCDSTQPCTAAAAANVRAVGLQPQALHVGGVHRTGPTKSSSTAVPDHMHYSTAARKLSAPAAVQQPVSISTHAAKAVQAAKVMQAARDARASAATWARPAHPIPVSHHLSAGTQPGPAVTIPALQTATSSDKAPQPSSFCCLPPDIELGVTLEDHTLPDLPVSKDNGRTSALTAVAATESVQIVEAEITAEPVQVSVSDHFALSSVAPIDPKPTGHSFSRSARVIAAAAASAAVTLLPFALSDHLTRRRPAARGKQDATTDICNGSVPQLEHHLSDSLHAVSSVQVCNPTLKDLESKSEETEAAVNSQDLGSPLTLSPMQLMPASVMHGNVLFSNAAFDMKDQSPRPSPQDLDTRQAHQQQQQLRCESQQQQDGRMLRAKSPALVVTDVSGIESAASDASTYSRATPAGFSGAMHTAEQGLTFAGQHAVSLKHDTVDMTAAAAATAPHLPQAKEVDIGVVLRASRAVTQDVERLTAARVSRSQKQSTLTGGISSRPGSQGLSLSVPTGTIAARRELPARKLSAPSSKPQINCYIQNTKPSNHKFTNHSSVQAAPQPLQNLAVAASDSVELDSTQGTVLQDRREDLSHPAAGTAGASIPPASKAQGKVKRPAGTGAARAPAAPPAPWSSHCERAGDGRPSTARAVPGPRIGHPQLHPVSGVSDIAPAQNPPGGPEGIASPGDTSRDCSTAASTDGGRLSKRGCASTGGPTHSLRRQEKRLEQLQTSKTAEPPSQQGPFNSEAVNVHSFLSVPRPGRRGADPIAPSSDKLLLLVDPSSHGPSAAQRVYAPSGVCNGNSRGVAVSPRTRVPKLAQVSSQQQQFEREAPIVAQSSIPTAMAVPAAVLSALETAELLMLRRVVSMASVLLARGRHAELASVLRVKVEPQLTREEGSLVGPALCQTAVQLGDIVQIGILQGVVRYLGPVHWHSAPYWLGVQLDPSKGVGNGTVNGVRYFDCPAGCGKFVLCAAARAPLDANHPL